MTRSAHEVSRSRPRAGRLALVAAGALLAACEPVDGSEPVDAKVAIDASPDAATGAATDAAIDASPDARVRVADSELDFAATQGAGGWQYLYEELPSAVRRELVHNGTAWVVDATRFWTQLSRRGGHPNVGGRIGESSAAIQLPVRRWLADTAGAATIAYRAGREHDQVCGDGVATRVIVDDVVRWEQSFPGTGPSVVEGELVVTLGPGSTVDLVMDPLATDGCDSTVFTAVITVTAPD